jgi:putative PIN family toxin of toxin-antitoxin system
VAGQSIFLVMAAELFTELEKVLKREKIYKKYHIAPDEIEIFLTQLRNCTGFVQPIPLDALPIHSRDRKDDKFLACALSIQCDYLITGDDDLLVLNGKKELNGLKIIRAAEFLQAINS